MYQKIEATLTGIAPLLMHAGRLNDPLDPFSKMLKKVTSKKTKTDDDYEEMGRIEWLGGLYTNADERIGIPADNLHSLIVAGCKKKKQGPLAKAGVFCQSFSLLDYEGPKKPDALYAKKDKSGDRLFSLRNRVKVNGNGVMRVRPFFPTGWMLPVDIDYEPTIINEEDVKEALITAGRVIGLGDWRPQFGRFEVEF